MSDALYQFRMTIKGVEVIVGGRWDLYFNVSELVSSDIEKF